MFGTSKFGGYIAGFSNARNGDNGTPIPINPNLQSFGGLHIGVEADVPGYGVFSTRSITCFLEIGQEIKSKTVIFDDLEVSGNLTVTGTINSNESSSGGSSSGETSSGGSSSGETSVSSVFSSSTVNYGNPVADENGNMVPPSHPAAYTSVSYLRIGGGEPQFDGGGNLIVQEPTGGVLPSLQVNGNINITGNYTVNGVALSGPFQKSTQNMANIYYTQGNVGIGHPNPANCKLHVDGGNFCAMFSVGIGTEFPLEKLQINNGNILVNNGNISASGTISSNSDDRIKYNETTIEDCLEKLGNMRTLHYEKIIDIQYNSGIWIPTDDEWEQQKDNFSWNNEIGLIAQDIKDISGCESIVSGSEYDQSGNQTPLSINYNAITALCVGAIKEEKVKREQLQGEVDTLNGEVSDLKTQIASLMTRLAALE